MHTSPALLDILAFGIEAWAKASERVHPLSSEYGAAQHVLGVLEQDDACEVQVVREAGLPLGVQSVPVWKVQIAGNLAVRCVGQVLDLAWSEGQSSEVIVPSAS